jgi:hypothetical protein
VGRERFACLPGAAELSVMIAAVGEVPFTVHCSRLTQLSPLPALLLYPEQRLHACQQMGRHVAME